MVVDERQIRTSNNVGLVGYRGRYHGENVIAIMKGKECRECLGILYLDQIQEKIQTGPYIDLDKLYK